MLPDQVQTEFVTLTAPAAKAVQDLLEKRNLTDFALRIFVSGGGCSGFQYGMALDDNFRETDIVAEMHGVKVVIDNISIDYLRGSNIDYIEDVMGSGFKIENPNAVAACGCGNSFRTKDSDASYGSSGGCGSH